MAEETVTRFCKHCNRDYPETKEHWIITPGKRIDFTYVCRVCQRERCRRARAKNRQHYNSKTSRYQQTIRGRYNRLKHRHKDATLTLDEYASIIKHDCYYCGDKLPTHGYGLDRRDNSKGYTAENCVACCDICNRAKRHHPEEVFYAWARRLVINLDKKGNDNGSL